MPSERAMSNLIGLIYDAACDPLRWPVFLEQLGQALLASASNIFVQNLRSQEFIVATGLGVDALTTEGHMNTTSRFSGILRWGITGCLCFLFCSYAHSQSQTLSNDIGGHRRAPSITMQPQSQTVTVPATATFAVTAKGPQLSYQWYKNGAAISGATLTTYTTPATTSGTNGAIFSVTATNRFGNTTSAPAVLTVFPAATMNLAPVGPVLIGGRPQSQTVVAGESATFSATAIGTEPISYQWNQNGTSISGATSATYTTLPTTSADDGVTFTVTVTNSVNSLTSSPATLTVTSGPVAPTITGQPQNVTVNQGNTGYFSVSATGTAPLSYQWSKNGTPITDATDPTYTTVATTAADNNAQFTVTVTNGASNVTSGQAALFVAPTAGLGGFQLPVPGFGAGDPVTPRDLTAIQYKFQVVTNNSKSLKIIFAGNGLYNPGSNIIYNTQSNVYSGTLSFADGGCTTFPPLGMYTEAFASLRHATADYPFSSGQTSAVGSGINTSDPVNWPIQTNLVDDFPNLYESVSISQFNLNGLEGLVTVQRGGTLTDVSSFENKCGVPMLFTTYRMWTITTQIAGHPTVVNQIVVPDADGRFIYPVQAMTFFSEFLDTLGEFTVQFWNFAYMTESNPVWTSASTFSTIYDNGGSGQNSGVHVVTVNGQDRVEFSNVSGNSYLLPNLRFSIAP